MNQPRRIPKSLHTITALVRVAHHLLRWTPNAPQYQSEHAAANAVSDAAILLGYPIDSTDPDELLDKAAAALATLIDSRA